MLKHTDQLYRLADLPAFIEEALSNVSLKGIITKYQAHDVNAVMDSIETAITEYAEEWVDGWMARNQRYLWHEDADMINHEIRAIEAGVKLFSNPDCKAGLPE